METVMVNIKQLKHDNKYDSNIEEEKYKMVFKRMWQKARILIIFFQLKHNLIEEWGNKL